MLENVVKFHFFFMVKYARVEALESKLSIKQRWNNGIIFQLSDCKKELQKQK